MPKPDPAKMPLAVELLAVLDQFVALHGELHACLERKQEALRVADIDAITCLCRTERELLRAIEILDQSRVDVIGRLSSQLAPRAGRALTLREIGPAVDPATRTGLATCAERLRDLIPRVRHASSVVTSAAETLSRHLAGIAQSVHRTLSQAGVYERRGRIAVGAQFDYVVDVKS